MPITPTDVSLITNFGQLLMLPTILPDEFLPGYLGRISLVNNRHSVQHIKNILQKRFSEVKHEIKATPLVVALAHALEIETDAIAQEHTLTPILRSTQPETINFPAELGIKSNYEFGLLSRLSLIIPKKLACFCESCVVEDVEYHGFSFWRRSHQIPGIDWCSKHMEPLQELQDPKAFFKQPSIFFKSGHYSKQTQSLGTHNPIILRYAQLIEDALELDVPVNNRLAQEILSKKAKSIGVKFSEEGTCRQLSDLMNEVLPEQWILKHFPRLKKESYGKFVAGFDEVLKSSRKGKSYINTLLAAAVLFDDADEAMHELTAQNFHLLNKENKQEISDISFVNAYTRHKGSYFKMCLEFGKDRRYIFNRARSLGLPSFTGVDSKTFRAIKDFYDGSNLIEILSRPDVNQEKFANIIRLSGRLFSSTIKKIDSIQ